MSRVFRSLLVVTSFFAISATSAPSNDIKTYVLTFTGTNCSIDGRQTFVEQIINGKTNLKYTIQVDEGYASPTDADVTCNVPFHINKSIITFTNPVTTNIDLEINVETPYQKEFDFSFTGDGCSINGKSEVSTRIENGKEDIRYTILPDSGKKMPTIEVTEGEDLVDYDIDTGVLVISKMTGNVTLTATSIDAPVTDSISFSGLNCKATGYDFDCKMFTFKAEKGRGYDFIITPDDGYVLPTAINVEIDGEPATPGSDYTYGVKEDEKYHLSFTLEGATLIYIKATEDDVTYTVTFNSNGGSTVLPIENITKGSIINEPAAPTLEGKKFNGWFLDNNTFKKRFNFEETAIIDNLTLYAQWIVETNDVTITLDAGRFATLEIADGERYYSFNVSKGTTWSSLSASLSGCLKRNYDFIYWALNGTKISEDTVINESIELEATYVPTSTEYLTFTPRNDNATLEIDSVSCSYDYMVENSEWKTVALEGDRTPVIDIKVNRETRIFLRSSNLIGNIFETTESSYFEISGPLISMQKDSSYFNFNNYFGLNYNLKSAYNLVLPTIDDYPRTTFNQMFSNCKSLVIPPNLLSTITYHSCYIQMFKQCSSLTVAPKISAENFETKACYEMFADCFSLNVAEGSGKNRFIHIKSTKSDSCKDMFIGTAGAFQGTPRAGKTYYFN